MPNWIDNIAHFTFRSNEEAKAFQYKIKQGKKLLTLIRPMPDWVSMSETHIYKEDVLANMTDEEREENPRGYSWLTWRLEHWGTKWDVSDSGISTELNSNVLTLRFETAWNPPMQAYSHALATSLVEDIKAYFLDECPYHYGKYSNGVPLVVRNELPKYEPYLTLFADNLSYLNEDEEDEESEGDSSNDN